MVGPLDSQIAINQSVAAEKVQEVQQRHPDLQQKQFAHQLQEEQDKKQRDIRDTEKTDQVLIRDHEPRKQKRKGRKKPGRDRSQKNEELLAEENRESQTGVRVDLFV